MRFISASLVVGAATCLLGCDQTPSATVTEDSTGNEQQITLDGKSATGGEIVLALDEQLGIEVMVHPELEDRLEGACGTPDDLDVPAALGAIANCVGGDVVDVWNPAIIHLPIWPIAVQTAEGPFVCKVYLPSEPIDDRSPAGNPELIIVPEYSEFHASLRRVRASLVRAGGERIELELNQNIWFPWSDGGPSVTGWRAALPPDAMDNDQTIEIALDAFVNTRAWRIEVPPNGAWSARIGEWTVSSDGFTKRDEELVTSLEFPTGANVETLSIRWLAIEDANGETTQAYGGGGRTSDDPNVLEVNVLPDPEPERIIIGLAEQTRQSFTVTADLEIELPSEGSTDE